MVFGVVDVGSNAIRMQVSRLMNNDDPKCPEFKKVEYIRFPLRLGDSVFSHGSIDAHTEGRFIKLMHVFRHMLDLYGVESYMACATSSMREAANGREIAKRTQTLTGLQLQIIDGIEEAGYIANALQHFIDDKHHYLHIDVGGGSTELNLYVRREKVGTQSYKLGSVRNLKDQDKKEVWEAVDKWVKGETKRLRKKVVAIGTGGNINKIFDLSSAKKRNYVSYNEAKLIRNKIASYTVEERVHAMKLNRDRADVIVPATDIYLRVMESAGAKRIAVPKVGLRDGMVYHLYKKSLIAAKK